MYRNKVKNPFLSETAPLTNPDEFRSWIVREDDAILVLNKPGWMVCHPSKNGPYSSLIGATREYLGTDSAVHLVTRLDRETSGLILIAKTQASARCHQVAVQKRRVAKQYLVIIHGKLGERRIVDLPLAPRRGGPVAVKSTVSYAGEGKRSVTEFIPRSSNDRYTLCEVRLNTGRRHQIRAHAEWMGHPVVGDKVYGPDEHLFLEFIESGWNDRMQQMLAMYRQAIHCWRYRFQFTDVAITYEAPIAIDMLAFMEEHSLRLT